MNRFILDTNIVLAYLLNNEKVVGEIESIFPLFTDENITSISIVTVGELYSLGMQRQWGKYKIEQLAELIRELVIVDINADDIIQKYSVIDAYSQGRYHQIPSSITSRNMGKNDLWIAATASATQSTLITTDADFNHLKDIFLKLIFIDLSK